MAAAAGVTVPVEAGTRTVVPRRLGPTTITTTTRTTWTGVIPMVNDELGETAEIITRTMIMTTPLVETEITAGLAATATMMMALATTTRRGDNGIPRMVENDPKIQQLAAKREENYRNNANAPRHHPWIPGRPISPVGTPTRNVCGTKSCDLWRMPRWTPPRCPCPDPIPAWSWQ